MDSTSRRSDFDTFISRVESPALLAIAKHWGEVRSRKRLPGWSDLAPSAISPHLTRLWSFRYDRQSGEFTGRLAGNRIMVATGHSFRGTTLKDLHPPHIYEKSHAEFTRIVTGPTIYRCRGPLFRAGGQVVDGERIVMPGRGWRAWRRASGRVGICRSLGDRRPVRADFRKRGVVSG